VVSLARLGPAGWGTTPSGILCPIPRCGLARLKDSTYSFELCQPKTTPHQDRRGRTTRIGPGTGPVEVTVRRVNPRGAERGTSRLPARRSTVQKARRRSTRSAPLPLSCSAPACGSVVRWVTRMTSGYRPNGIEPTVLCVGHMR